MNRTSHASPVDLVFAQFHGERQGFAMPLPSAPPAVVAKDSLRLDQADMKGVQPYVWPQPPPAVNDSNDMQVAHQWLQAERKRLEEYTRDQFALIQQQHQALLAKHFRSEEAMALRAQELNREMQFLASQSKTLQERARELSERESALALQMNKLAEAHQELIESRQVSAPLQQDRESRRALLEQLRAEAAELQARGAGGRAEAEALETALRQRQEAWERKHAQLMARQVEMEQRYEALEKNEAAAKRWLRELEELEDQLRTEFEQQEHRLASERREMEALRSRLRSQVQKLEHVPLATAVSSMSGD
jgi:chromosome segregation ATPase